MNENFIKTKNRQIYSYISVFFICIFIIICMFLIEISQSKNNNSEYIIMNLNWSIEVNGKVTNDVKIDDYHFDNISKGDKVILTTKLPDIDYMYPMLQIKTYYCNVRCIIDNKEIYNLNQSDNPGKNICNIELKNQYLGKEIAIELEVVENNAFSLIKAPKLMNEIDYSNIFASEHVIECALCIFILMLGIIVIISVLINGTYNQKQRKLLWIGIFSVAISMWLLSFLDIIYMIIECNHISSVFEYINILVAVQAMMLYFFDSFIDKYCKRVFIIMFTVGIVILSVGMILNKYGRVYLINFQLLFNIYIIISFCIAIYIFHSKNTLQYMSNKIEVINGGLFVLTGIIRIIRSIIIKTGSNPQIISIVLVISVFILVLSMIWSYVEYLKELFNETAEKSVLTKMAYQDMLTGVSNRIKCKEYMDNLKINKSKNVTVVYFDLNYLKVINDTMGHIRGDNYICEFARILEEEFGESGLVGRIGGDEFIAVNNIENEDSIKKKIDNMVEMAAQGDNPNIGMKISFAYGYALSNKEECYSVFELEKIADKRMYECKANQKAGRK